MQHYSYCSVIWIDLKEYAARGINAACFRLGSVLSHRVIALAWCWTVGFGMLGGKTADTVQAMQPVHDSVVTYK
jgi:hypothetical protein